MTPFLIIAALAAGLIVAHETGHRLGVRYRDADEAFTRQMRLVRDASLAMLAFLIGFAFAGAGSRFIDRSDLIIKEANALGTAYLRADAVDAAQRGALKAVIKEYTTDRVRLLDSADSTEIERLLGRVGGLQQKMWRLRLEGSGASPQLMQLVLPSINAVIDLHTTHLYTAHRHLPPAIMAVLLGIAAVGF